MNTKEIMNLALEMADLETIPGDTAIYNTGQDIERVLMGIDINSPELILADRMEYDLAISHHPFGNEAILGFHRVFERHVQQMIGAGVSEAVAQEAVEDLTYDTRIINSIRNYDHAPSVARLLDMPYMNIHTPLDEIGRKRMAEVASQLNEQATVSDLIALFQDEFGEFRNARTKIEARVGEPQNHLGRAVVSHGAGTNGGYRVAKAYFDSGIDTVVYIHCKPSDSKRLEEEYREKRKNLIVTGHIASDSIGINPFIDRLRDRGLDVTPISGIIPPG